MPTTPSSPPPSQMSLLIDSSPKDCSTKGRLVHLPKRNRRLLCTLSSVAISLLFTIFLVCLVLHPSKPQFYLKDTAVFELSLAAPRLLNSTIQTTILSKNPNAHVGIYYDRLRTYAAYRGQQITGDAALPPFYQGHQDVNVLSAALYGAGVPVAPTFDYEVGRDQVAGRMYLDLRVDGQLRWKVGSWVSGRYRINVSCVAVVVVRPAGAADGPMTLLQGGQCSTSV